MLDVYPPGPFSNLWMHQETGCFKDLACGIPQSALPPLTHSNPPCYSCSTQVLIPPNLSLSPYLEVTMPFLEGGGQQDNRERTQVWILGSDLMLTSSQGLVCWDQSLSWGRGAEAASSLEVVEITQGREAGDLNRGAGGTAVEVVSKGYILLYFEGRFERNCPGTGCGILKRLKDDYKIFGLSVNWYARGKNKFQW